MTMNLNHLLDNDKLKKLTDRFGNNFILAWVLAGTRFEEFQERHQIIEREKKTRQEMANTERMEMEKLIIENKVTLKIPQFKMDAFTVNKK